MKKLLQMMVMFRQAFLGMFLQCLFCNVLLADGDRAGNRSIDEVFINVHVRNGSLRESPAVLEEEKGFYFFYNKEVLVKFQAFIIQNEKRTLGNILHQISYLPELTRGINSNLHISNIHVSEIENGDRVIGGFLGKAPPIEVSGRVTDQKGMPLPGVNIVEKGTNNGTITDVEGKYRIIVSDESAVLVFSSIGYRGEEIAVGGQSTINLTMTESAETLREVVVIGYTTQQKKDVTSSVGSVDVESLQRRAVTDVTHAIQGNVAGVNIIAANGNPGSDIVINIRGVSSFSGDNTPLVVVDGVQVETGLRELNPNDIMSIEVLKDASSAAVYGSRAANGVILVTTKKGVRGKPQVTYQNYLGLQVPYAGISVANSREYVTILQRMYGEDLSGGDLIPQAAKDYLANPNSFQDYDWQDLIYRTAPMQNHDLSVSGGGDFGTYRISVDYLNQQGITIGTGYKRGNVRANSEFNINENLKFGQSISLARSNTETEPYAFSRSTFYQAIAMYPYFSPKLPNGDWRTSSFYYGGGDNPEALIRNPFHYRSIWDGDQNDNDISLNMYGELIITKGLQYKLSGSYSEGSFRTRNYFGDKGEFQDEYFDDNLSLFEAEGTSYNYSIDNILRYERRSEVHAVDATVGFIAQKFGSRYMDGYKNGFLSDITSTLDGPGGKNAELSGNREESSLLSLIAQAFYSYDDRYLITLNFRRDGSSRFGADYRWGNFPGVSVGWRLSGENFWQNSALNELFSDLKIRGGYGILGRQNLGSYDYQPVLVYVPAVFGESVHDGLITGTPINEAISWERLISKTIGIDVEMFDGKFSGSFDYYDNDTEDMIIGVAIAPSAGGGEMQSNVGEINNKGFEISLNHNNHLGDFSYDVGFNLGTTKTTLINIGTELIEGDGPEWDVPHAIEIRQGGPVAAYWLIETDGLFGSQEEIDNYISSEGIVIQPDAQPGDIRFVDANDDGEITSEGDRQYQGSGMPKVNMGFNLSCSYKKFDLNLNLTGAFGQVIYNGPRYLIEQNYGYDNFSTRLLDAFDPVTNPNSDFPRLNPDDVDENWNSRPTSDRYIEDGDYVKVRNIELGYSLPDNILNKISMSSARVFARVQNLVNITGYTGSDPEVGSSPIVDDDPIYTAGLDRDTAPQARSFQVGVSITFK